MNLDALSLLPVLAQEGIVFILGACIGGFLNVCIHRIPLGLSVVRPRSRCPQCETPIAWWDNIPLISWLLLRGKCRHCQAPIAFRYFLVELIAGALFLLCWMLLPAPVAFTGMLFVSWMLVIALIDLDTFTIPDGLVLSGCFVGLVASFAVPEIQGYSLSNSMGPWVMLYSAFSSLAGILLASGFVLWLMLIFEKILRREAMGLGDATLLGCIGAFCGIEGALFALLAGSIIGTVVIIPLMLLERIFGWKLTPRMNPDELDNPEGDVHAEELKFGIAIPFGPWLSVGGILYFLFMRGWVYSYLEPFYSLWSMQYS